MRSRQNQIDRIGESLDKDRERGLQIELERVQRERERGLQIEFERVTERDREGFGESEVCETDIQTYLEEEIGREREKYSKIICKIT